MSMIEDIKADRINGTPGPWMAGHFSDDTHSCNCRSILGEHGGFGALAVMEVDNGLRIGEGGNDAPDLEQSKANARRIARVPDMEAALLAANALDLILAEVEYLKPERYADPEGAYHVTMPAGEWDALLSDVARVRAAYRAATATPADDADASAVEAWT